MAGLGQRTGRRRSEELQGAGGAGGWSEQRSGVPERGPFCPQPRHWLGQRPSRGCTASLGWGLGRTALAGVFPELGPRDLLAAFVGTVGQTQESGVSNQLGVVSEGQTDPRAGLRDGRFAGSFLLGPGGPPTPCGHCPSWARGPVPRPCPRPHVAAPRVRVCAARRGQGHRPQGDLVFPSYSCNRPASKQVARESWGVDPEVRVLGFVVQPPPWPRLGTLAIHFPEGGGSRHLSLQGAECGQLPGPFLLLSTFCHHCFL